MISGRLGRLTVIAFFLFLGSTAPPEAAREALAFKGTSRGKTTPERPRATAPAPTEGETVLAVGTRLYTVRDFLDFYRTEGVAGRSIPEVYESFTDDRLLREEVRASRIEDRTFVRHERAVWTDRYLAKRYLGQVLAPTLEATEAEVQGRLPPGSEQVRLQVIIFPDNGAMAAEVLGMARAGEDFSTLVEEYSQAWFGTEGKTDFLFANSDLFSPAGMKKVFELKVGEVSDILAGPMGYGIVKVLEKRDLPAGERQSLERNARERLAQQKRNEVMQKYLARADYAVLEANLKKAVEASMVDRRPAMGDLPVLRLNREEYPFRTIVGIIGVNSFELQESRGLLEVFLKEKCQEVAMAHEMAKDARSFGIRLSPAQEQQIEDRLIKLAANELLREKSAGVSSEQYKEWYRGYLTELREKYTVVRYPSVLSAVEIHTAEPDTGGGTDPHKR